MSPRRRRLSELRSSDLLRRASEYRTMATTAHGSMNISLNKLALRFAMLAAKRETEERQHEDSAVSRGQSELGNLIRLAEQAARSESDPVEAIAGNIRRAAEDNADPYLLVGVLLEGIVHVTRTEIPTVRREETACAVLKLLADRMNGLVPR